MSIEGRRKSTARTGRKRSESLDRMSTKQRANESVKARSMQAAILTIANDAALVEEYDRAKDILAQGRQRRIDTDYKTVTPESALKFEFADRGSERESIEVTAADIAEQRKAGSHAPVRDAIVKRAARWLRYNGGGWVSSEDGVSYSSSSEVTNVYTGEERKEEFFLCNFTVDERRLIVEELARTSRTN